MTGEVLTPQTVWLDGVQYRILGEVHELVVDPFPPKLQIGPSQRYFSTLYSTWNLEDFKGGLGSRQVPVDPNYDRYRIGEGIDTRFERQLLLGPQVTNAGRGDIVALPSNIGVTYRRDNRLYVVFNGNIRRWNETTRQFEAFGAPNTLSVDYVSSFDALSLRLGDTDWLVFCDGSKLLAYDGTTWTQQDGAVTGLYPRFFAYWDRRLWALDRANRVWYTTDLNTWTQDTGGLENGGQIPVEAYGVRDFFVYRDRADNRVLMATTSDGLWAYDAGAHAWVQTDVQYPYYFYNGMQTAVYNGELIVPIGPVALRYNGAVVSPLGLNYGGGLPQDYHGDIISLASSLNWLALGTSTLKRSGRVGVYLWDGGGFHPLWVAPTVQRDAINWLHATTADDVPRLWWGTTESVYYAPLPRGVFNPREDPTWTFAETGFLQTGWADMGAREVPKTAVRVRARGAHCTADETITISYAIDDNEQWTRLGTLSDDTLQVFSFADGAGVTFYTLAFRIELRRGLDATRSPALLGLTLEFYLAPDVTFGYQLILDLTRASDQYTPAALRARLETLAQSKLPVQFAYRPASQPAGNLLTRRVRVSSFTAMSPAGPDSRGRYRLSLVEV